MIELKIVSCRECPMFVLDNFFGEDNCSLCDYLDIQINMKNKFGNEVHPNCPLLTNQCLIKISVV